jgi:hypothetical protein
MMRVLQEDKDNTSRHLYNNWSMLGIRGDRGLSWKNYFTKRLSASHDKVNALLKQIEKDQKLYESRSDQGYLMFHKSTEMIGFLDKFFVQKCMQDKSEGDCREEWAKRLWMAQADALIDDSHPTWTSWQDHLKHMEPSWDISCDALENRMMKAINLYKILSHFQTLRVQYVILTEFAEGDDIAIYHISDDGIHRLITEAVEDGKFVYHKVSRNLTIVGVHFSSDATLQTQNKTSLQAWLRARKGIFFGNVVCGGDWNHEYAMDENFGFTPARLNTESTKKIRAAKQPQPNKTLVADEKKKDGFGSTKTLMEIEQEVREFTNFNLKSWEQIVSSEVVSNDTGNYLPLSGAHPFDHRIVIAQTHGVKYATLNIGKWEIGSEENFEFVDFDSPDGLKRDIVYMMMQRCALERTEGVEAYTDENRKGVDTIAFKQLQSFAEKKGVAFREEVKNCIATLKKADSKPIVHKMNEALAVLSDSGNVAEMIAQVKTDDENPYFSKEWESAELKEMNSVGPLNNAVKDNIVRDVWRKAAKAGNIKQEWINLMMELIEKRGKTQGLVNELKKDEIEEMKKAEGKRFYFGAGEDVDRIRSALNHWWNYYDTFFLLLDNIEKLEIDENLLQ